MDQKTSEVNFPVEFPFKANGDPNTRYFFIRNQANGLVLGSFLFRGYHFPYSSTKSFLIVSLNWGLSTRTYSNMFISNYAQHNTRTNTHTNTHKYTYANIKMHGKMHQHNLKLSKHTRIR